MFSVVVVAPQLRSHSIHTYSYIIVMKIVQREVIFPNDCYLVDRKIFNIHFNVSHCPCGIH